MGDLYKQKVVIIVAFGILSLIVFFTTIGVYSNKLDEELNNYCNKAGTYIGLIMDVAKTRNMNAIEYAIADDYFDDTYENIISKQHQDDHITSLCKEIKSIVPNIQSVLAVMENGEVYAADNTFDSYIEQFKNIKNSGLYKDTCCANIFKINKYNKYYNVECYSYSDAIFDKNGKRVGTIIVTYDLNWVWNEINNLNKDDFIGTIIFETFDKQVLSIIDENGIERYSENELIGDRAQKILDEAKSSYINTDNEREYNIYFVAGNERINSLFNSTRTYCLGFVLGVFIFLIILTNRRKSKKYILEITIITASAFLVYYVLWFTFTESWYKADSLIKHINQYTDVKYQEQYELSQKRGIDAFLDTVQTTLFKNISNQITTKEFINIFTDGVLNYGIDEYQKVKKHFTYGKPINIIVDENKKIDFENRKIVNTTLNEKVTYNKLIKSGEGEMSITERIDDKINKTIFYKTRIFSKYTMVFTCTYDVNNFFENNTSERYNIDELGETYYVDYSDGFKIGLIRANEIGMINNISELNFIEVNNDIFKNSVKRFIESEKDFEMVDAVGAVGSSTKMILFNNKDLQRVEIYFVKECAMLTSQSEMATILLILVMIYASLILYVHLENRRMKRKDKKEEIVLHGNY